MAAFDRKTVLYAASVRPLRDDRLFAAAYRAVSPERRHRTDRFRQAADRYLSLGAELLLGFGLRACGADAPVSDLIRGAQGKPYLKNGDVSFNLSHSGEYVICALSGDEVGCDVEQLLPVDLQLARRFFCPSEYDDIAAQPTPEAKRDLFFRYWTLKESFLKATGLGMKLPLNAFQIVRGDKIDVIQSVDDRRYRFAEFADIPGYRCALCTVGDSPDTALRFVDLADIIARIG